MRTGSALVAGCLALTLAACGGGGGTTSSTGPGSTAIAPSPNARRGPGKTGSSAKAPMAHPGKSTSEAKSPNPRTASPQHGKGHVAAHGAAAFKMAGADNSVPNYGTEGSSTQRKEATEALTAYLNARLHSEWSKACDLMAVRVRQSLSNFVNGPGGKAAECPEVLKGLAASTPDEPLDPLTGGLAAFRVGSRYGFALFFGPHRQKYAEPMILERSGWKVTQVAPSPYPPGQGVAGG